MDKTVAEVCLARSNQVTVSPLAARSERGGRPADLSRVGDKRENPKFSNAFSGTVLKIGVAKDMKLQKILEIRSYGRILMIVKHRTAAKQACTNAVCIGIGCRRPILAVASLHRQFRNRHWNCKTCQSGHYACKALCSGSQLSQCLLKLHHHL